MVTIVLDPGLLAYLPLLPKGTVLEKVNQLATWSKVSGTRSWVRIALVPGARRLLEVNDFVPAYEPAKRLLEATGLGHVYSPKDLIRPVYDLLETAVSSPYCCVVDELHQEFESNPPQPWHGDDPKIEGLSQHALLMSAVENRVHGSQPFQLFASILKAELITFTAQVEVVDPDSIPGFCEHDMPKTVGDQFQHVSSLEDVCGILNANDVWANALSPTDIKLAIQLACRAKMIDLGTYSGFDKIPVFYVGADFFGSLKLWEADKQHKFAGATLDACAAAVLELSTIEVKPFVKPRRAADMAEPLRAHISKTGVGMRLMIWQRVGTRRCLEFANVGGKHEEEISYTDPLLAT
jgi:hypothetical protein